MFQENVRRKIETKKRTSDDFFRILIEFEILFNVKKQRRVGNDGKNVVELRRV